VTAHSRSSRSQTSRPPSAIAAATGSKKFSLNSSDRATIRNTTPIANASAPTSAGTPDPEPVAGWTSSIVTTSATIPNTTVTPAMNAVATWSSSDICSRRRPSCSARS
jgi:hypothetical protein